jgi:hypothetical protein
VVKVKVRVSMAGGWKGWEKEAKMTGLGVKSVCWVQGLRKNKGRVEEIKGNG